MLTLFLLHEKQTINFVLFLFRSFFLRFKYRYHVITIFQRQLIILYDKTLRIFQNLEKTCFNIHIRTSHLSRSHPAKSQL